VSNFVFRDPDSQLQCSIPIRFIQARAYDSEGVEILPVACKFCNESMSELVTRDSTRYICMNRNCKKVKDGK